MIDETGRARADTGIGSGAAARVSTSAGVRPEWLARSAFLLMIGMTASPLRAQTSDSALPPITVDSPQNRVRPSAASRPSGSGDQVARRNASRRRAAVAARSRPQVSGAQIPAPSGEGEGSREGRGGPAPLGGELPAVTVRRQSTQSVGVADRKQIEETNPAGALDILKTIPGVSISRSGGIGGQPYVRGFNSNDFRVAVFVDGDRFRGRNTLQFLLFPPDDIQRIEVIRGPASSIYGSDGLAGLINITTRRAMVTDPNGPFRITGGGYSLGYGSSASSSSGNAFVEGAGEGFDMRLSVTGTRGDDYHTPQGIARNSDYSALSGNLNLGYSPTADQRVELVLRDTTVSDGRAGGTGGAPGFPLLKLRDATLQVRQARIGYSGDFAGQLIDHVEATVYVNQFYTKQTSISNTVARQSTFSDSYVFGPTVPGGRILANAGWGDLPIGTGKTTFGADFFKETRPGPGAASQVARFNAAGALTSYTASPFTVTGPQTYQSDAGAFILNEWTPIPQLTFSAAGRYDVIETQTDLNNISSPTLLSAFRRKSDTERNALTGGTGVVIRILPYLDLVGNVGTSYRAPVNNQLFTGAVQGAGFSIPNPDLRPEKGITYEGGARLHVEGASASLTAFRSDYRDLILSRTATTGGVAITQFQNVSTADIEGLEGEGRWQLTRTVNLFGGLTYLYGTKTSAPATPLPYIQPLFGRVGVQYVPVDTSYSLMATLDLAKAKTRIDATQEFKSAGYAVLNLYSRLDLGKLISPQLGRTDLIIGLENVLNQSYRSASTFANVAFSRSPTNPLLEPGRNFTARIQHTF